MPLLNLFSILAATSLKHEAHSGPHLMQLNVNHNIGPQNLPKTSNRKSANEPLRKQTKIHNSMTDSNNCELAEDFSATMGHILRPDRAWLILIMLLVYFEKLVSICA